MAEHREVVGGIDLELVELTPGQGSVRLVLDAFNPLVEPRNGMLVRLACRTAAGGSATLLAIATTSADEARAQRIAAEAGGATILIDDRGFPGGERIRLSFTLPLSAPLAADGCGRPELRGVW